MNKPLSWRWYNNLVFVENNFHSLCCYWPKLRYYLNFKCIFPFILFSRNKKIWDNPTNVGILLIGTLGTKFSEIFIEIHSFSFQKLHLKNVVWKIAAILCLPQCVKQSPGCTDNLFYRYIRMSEDEIISSKLSVNLALCFHLYI